MVRQVYVQKIEEVQIGKNPELLNIFKLHKKNRQLKLTIITNIQQPVYKNNQIIVRNINRTHKS